MLRQFVQCDLRSHGRTVCVPSKQPSACLVQFRIVIFNPFVCCRMAAAQVPAQLFCACHDKLAAGTIWQEGATSWSKKQGLSKTQGVSHMYRPRR